MGKEKVGVGCLPLFLIVIILSIIRFQVAPGKSWERGFTDFTVALYWIGVGYMLLVVVINKSNEPRELNKEERLILSISEHKKNIEKYIDINGQFKETYKEDNSEYLSHHLVELFNANKELSYYKSRGWSFNSYSFNKKSDHEERRKMIAKVIKDKGLQGFVFWGGLYEGQAFSIYYGIGECQAHGCNNQVTEDWHSLCNSCFREENYNKHNRY
ncbi:hypothetical protein APF79_00725 [bacterium BRH_c32]|nr:MAG: hypothetical protein APF79_00725 [bacterium BRH_c32]